jgi:hypothetical protein
VASARARHSTCAVIAGGAGIAPLRIDWM